MKNNFEKPQPETFRKNEKGPDGKPAASNRVKKKGEEAKEVTPAPLERETFLTGLAREAEKAFSRNDFDTALEKLRELQRAASPEEKKERIDTQAITATLKKLLEEGAGKSHVAWGLAGVGTPEAMAMRERLLKEGAGKNYVALGLAGVGTPEAMAMREKLLEEGADKGWVAQGLAGVGTPEAMAMREKLLEEGANKGYVAYGLAGVGTPEAMEFRKRHFGDKPTTFAKSYSSDSTAIDGVICRYGYEK
jgi:hypothetical protein